MLSLQVKGNNSKLLSVDLIDVLDSLQNGGQFHWAILWIYATGDLGENRSILEFEDQINHSQNGIMLDWQELRNLALKFDQVMEILLIGAVDKQSLRKYATDDEMFKTCDYSIELIDSSYWVIHALNKQLLEVIKERLPGSEFLNE